MFAGPEGVRAASGVLKDARTVPVVHSQASALNGAAISCTARAIHCHAVGFLFYKID